MERLRLVDVLGATPEAAGEALDGDVFDGDVVAGDVLVVGVEVSFDGPVPLLGFGGVWL